MGNAMEKRIKIVMSAVLEIPIGQIKEVSSPDTIESWDSFLGLVLIDELESNFNVQFSLSEIVDTKTIKQIKNILKNHGVD